MKPHYESDGITIYHGDCRELMAEMEPNGVDAIVTDPPYGLEFMGKEWDRLQGSISAGSFKDFKLPSILGSKRNVKCPECGKWGYDWPKAKCVCGGIVRYKQNTMQQWHQQWAEVAYRVAKPGAHLLAFGGTRTHHRLMCAIEDAGWEIRDCLMWLYGSGFPKSLDVGKAIDKAAGQPQETTYQPNLRNNDYGKGMGGGKTDTTTQPITDAARQWDGWGTALKPAYEPIVLARKPLSGTVAGNVQEHGTGALNVDGCRVGAGGQLKWAEPRDMGYHGGTNSDAPPQENPSGRWPANVVLDEEAAAMLDEQSGERPTGALKPYKQNHNPSSYSYASGKARAQKVADSGGASRFFYCAKASRSERNTGDADNDHPTVKPLSLVQWLCTLVTPPGGLILDPFMGSGTTILAAHELNFRAIGIDLEEKHCEIAVQRLGQGVLDLGGAAS